MSIVTMKEGEKEGNREDKKTRSKEKTKKKKCRKATEMLNEKQWMERKGRQRIEGFKDGGNKEGR